MTTQYTPILKLALPVTGELSGTWGDVVNDNITSMVEQAVAGLATISTWTGNSKTLTTANGTTSESRCAMLVAQNGTGLSAAGEIICPAASKLYVLKNDTSYTITLKTAAGTGVAVASGNTAFLFCDGTNVNACVTTIVDGRVTGNLTVDGNATINGNTTLGNATSDTITATARFASDLVPSTDNARDLGSSANSWRSLWIDGTATMALVAISGGTIDGVSIGATTPATIINVDNLSLNGNTISSTDTNGNVVIAPNGTGDVQLDADTVRVGDSGAAATLTSNGAGALTVTTGGAANLVLSTNSGTDSGTITIANGANGNISIVPNGTGDVQLDADTVRIGDANTDVTLTSNGTGNLNLSTNGGTNSGTIQIAQGANASISLTPNGTGTTVIKNPSINGSTTINDGTANGVAYLNGSKVLTTGSALTFDGSAVVTLLAAGGTPYMSFSRGGGTYLNVGQDATGPFYNSAGSNNHRWLIDAGATEAMRLTSTGLRIATTVDRGVLTVNGATATQPSIGSATGSLFSMLSASNYGLIGGVNAAGNVWMQAGRVDGTATAYDLYLQSNGGFVGIGTSTPTAKLDVNGGAAVTGTDALNLQRPVVPSFAGQGAPAIQWRFYTTGTTYTAGAMIQGLADAAWSSTSAPTSLRFYTTRSGSTSMIESMRTDASGMFIDSGSGGGRLTFLPGSTANQILSTTTGFGAYNILRYQGTQHQWFNGGGSQVMTISALANLLVNTTSDDGSKVRIKNFYSFGSKNAHIFIDGGDVSNTGVVYSGGYVSQDVIGGIRIEQGATYYGAGLSQTDSVSTTYSAAGFGDGTIRFFTNAGLTANTTFTPTQRAILNTSGIWGINTTPSSWTPSIGLMDFRNNGGLSSDGSYFYLSNNIYYDGVNNRRKSANPVGVLGVGGASGVPLILNYSATGAADSVIALTEALRVNGNGNLLLGTTADIGRLGVAGEIVRTANGGVDGAFLTVLKYGTTSDLTSGTSAANRWIGLDATVSAGAGTLNVLRVRAYPGTTGNAVPNNVADFRGDQSTYFYGNALFGESVAYGGLTISADRVGILSPGVHIWVNTNATNKRYALFEYNGNGGSGSITPNGTSAVSYNTTSDYRLKENIQPMTGALAKVQALKPCTYNWKADGSEAEGFIAHELAEVCPQAVTGEKDAVDSNGKPIYQGVDTSFLVATLTAAIQELKAEFDAYKATHP